MSRSDALHAYLHGERCDCRAQSHGRRVAASSGHPRGTRQRAARGPPSRPDELEPPFGTAARASAAGGRRRSRRHPIPEPSSAG
eukprot:2631209-Prymnesium_polylepis.2